MQWMSVMGRLELGADVYSVIDDGACLLGGGELVAAQRWIAAATGYWGSGSAAVGLVLGRAAA